MRGLQLPILHRDDDVVVVNKPSGLVVHRGWGTDRVVAMTIVRDQLHQHVFPVHRLDRGTSGALVFALSAEMAAPLAASFEEGRAAKRYLALVRGTPPDEGVIDHAIPNSPDGPRVPAVTCFRLLFTFEVATESAGGRFSLVEANPETGRLHQVRRHLKHLNHPLVGDVNYGRGEINRLFREKYGLHRLALHALELAFPHPRTGEQVRARAPVPPDLAEPFAKMGIPPELWS